MRGEAAQPPLGNDVAGTSRRSTVEKDAVTLEPPGMIVLMSVRMGGAGVGPYAQETFLRQYDPVQGRKCSRIGAQ